MSNKPKHIPGADIGSDQNPVVMKLLVKLKQLKCSKRDPKLDMSMLRNEDLKNRYNLSIQNRYEILAIEDGFQLTEERQIENQWKMLKDSMVNAAKEVLPCKKKETKQSWMTKNILEKMRERKKAKSNDQAKYNRLRKEIEMDCRRAKDEW